MSVVEAIRADVLSDVPHAFFGRRGGVSEGVVGGLNAGWGSGDKHEAIAENRRRAIRAVLPAARLATVHQVHSATVVEAGDWPEDHRPHADALVTDKPGILLGILTADCAPVLLADREAGIIAAAHAGWRGALAGITDAAIAAMEGLGAHRDRLTAAIGPCIAARNYEVDDSFRERFLGEDPSSERFFSAGARGEPHFDLEAYVAARLAAAGVTRVEALGLDTYSASDRFYSYRRATHRAQPAYGRQISLIGL